MVIGGGTGTFMVLSALKNYDLNLTAVVSMADDGGSTGILRDQYGVLPPGDIRRALVALSRNSGILRELFNFRFEGGDFKGHNFGNIFLSALEKINGNFGLAVKEASKILNIEGSVLPVTLDNVRLNARLESGDLVCGETRIDIPKKGKTRARISKVWLRPRANINPEAIGVFKKADLIILGPGDLYTSLIPNLLVKGIAEVIRKSPAKKVFVCNLMTKFGETDDFCAEDFISEIEKYLGAGVLDYAIFNNKKPHTKILARYKKEKAEFITPPVVQHRMLDNNKPKFILADLLDDGPFIRHNPRKKLAKVLTKLIN